MLEIEKYIEDQFEIGNFGRVENACDKLIASGDDELIKKGYLYKGVSIAGQNRDEEAINLFDVAIEKFPDFEDYYIFKFESLIALGLFEEARIVAEKVISFEPTKPEYLDKLITVDEYLGNYNLVIETCNTILNFYPNLALFYSVRGAAKINLELYTEAINDYLKADQLEERDEIERAQDLNDIGFCYVKLENYAKAKEVLEESLKLDPTLPYALNNLGFTLAQLNEVENGLTLIKESIRLEPGNPYAYLYRGKINISLGEIDSAKKDLLRAKELDFEVLYGNEVNRMLNEIKNY